MNWIRIGLGIGIRDRETDTDMGTIKATKKKKLCGYEY